MTDLFHAVAAEEAGSRRKQMLRTAFGPTIAAALADPTVLEVMLNPDGWLWIDRASEGGHDTGERIATAEAERIIRLVAAHLRREVMMPRRLCPPSCPSRASASKASCRRLPPLPASRSASPPRCSTSWSILLPPAS